MATFYSDCYKRRSHSCREIITVNVGGTGVNLGQSTLHQYCVEQGISCNGDKEFKTDHDTTIPVSFTESPDGKYTARSLFIDLDPYSINMMTNFFKYSNIINPECLIVGKETAASNFAAGHYTRGKELSDTINEKLRIMVEDCDNVEGFIMHHSLSGGTGSGLGALCLERVGVDYRKKTKIGFHVFLDEQKSISPLQVMNVLVALHWLLDYTETSIILDNLQLNTICRTKLNIKTPRFKHYNYLCNKLISNITAPWRFGMREDMKTFSQNASPFWRLHFLTTSLAQIMPKTEIKTNGSVALKDDIELMTNQCVMKENFFYQCNDFNVKKDKYMSLMFNYRGIDINKCMYDVSKCMASLNDKKTSFIEWSNDQASVQYIDGAPVPLQCDDIYCGDKQVTMIANNTCIARLFKNRIGKKYDKLWSQRAYYHYPLGEGIESGEFPEAREDLHWLQKDYLDVFREYDTDTDTERDTDENI